MLRPSTARHEDLHGLFTIVFGGWTLQVLILTPEQHVFRYAHQLPLKHLFCP
jgi:hypothetical protein